MPKTRKEARTLTVSEAIQVAIEGLETQQKWIGSSLNTLRSMLAEMGGAQEEVWQGLAEEILAASEPEPQAKAKSKKKVTAAYRKKMSRIMKGVHAKRVQAIDEPAEKPKRTFSAAARKRMSQAQRKRRAEARAMSATG